MKNKTTQHPGMHLWIYLIFKHKLIERLKNEIDPEPSSPTESGITLVDDLK
jgi:hypothetical protein